MKLSRVLRRYWFLTLLVLLLPIGTLWPAGGNALREVDWAIPIFVATTLAISGFLLDTSRLVRQATNLRAIGLALGSTYLVAPILAFGLARVFGPSGGESAAFTQGMMLVAAQAGTLASALALTIMTRGDQELALVLTLLSNALTVVLTPLVLKIAIGANVEFDALAMIARMCTVVLLPVVLGQALRRALWSRAQRIVPALRVVPQLIILVFVYTGVAAAADQVRSEVALALRYFAACALLHTLLLAWNYAAATIAGLPVSARTAIVFCGAQKTLPNGIDLWNRFFSANAAGAVPLVLFHLFQLVVDTLLVPFFERQNRTAERAKQTGA